MFDENKTIALLRRYVPGYHIYVEIHNPAILYCTLGTPENFIFNLAAELPDLHSYKELPAESYREALEIGTHLFDDPSFTTVAFGSNNSVILTCDDTPNCFFEMQHEVFSTLTEDEMLQIKEHQNIRTLSEPYQCYRDNGEIVIY